jgi:hypothetical protein
MNSDLAVFAKQCELVVMAGAGLSAGNPSALPDWYATDAAIGHVLFRRVWSLWFPADAVDGLYPEGGPFKIDDVDLAPIIDTMRTAGRFPPDYQAQVIQEMCGDRYFRALQALDVDAINAGHDGIAALAAAGALKAVVTTNFDRLIELALEKRGVKHIVAKDDKGYVEMSQRLKSRGPDPLPVLKIHGSVTDHRSMIDTLKQRKLGRSRKLQECMDALQSSYWVYLGFSAADLETDQNYLGLVAGAARSAGATYVAYPRNADFGKQTKMSGKDEQKEMLRKGAQLLMNAHGERGQVVEGYVAVFLENVCQALGVAGPDPIPDDVALGPVQFQSKLEEWAKTLSPASAGLCLGAVLEAVGQAEPAVRILDKLVRGDELRDRRNTADFRALQLHYGRLGAAWGRFVAVSDMGGAASKASVESTQSLTRLVTDDSELEFAANTWLACAWLWLGDGQQAFGTATSLLKGLTEGWEGAKPLSDEEAVDAWLSAAQVYIINSHDATLNWIVGTAGAALDRGHRCGDVVRAARVTALKALALAETRESVLDTLYQHEQDFVDAKRVGDGFALGMRDLARARWHLHINHVQGLATPTSADLATSAQQSLRLLNNAMEYFERQAMDPWLLYARVQAVKAFADLHLSLANS